MYLGIDLGSIALKVVLLDGERNIVFSTWTRVAGEPFVELARVLREMAARHPDVRVDGIGATGSGRKLIAEALSALAVNEISAHARAATALLPDVRTIIEIGGQDSKLMILDGDAAVSTVKDFRMNELCAAGTGAFLDQQAARLDMSIEQFAQLACDATSPVPIAGRCAVFAKTDMTHHQQEGRSLADIVAGLNEALVRSYLANLVRGRDLPKPMAFQGGVASNKGLVDAFRKMLGLEHDDLIVPEHHRIMGAIGAALAANPRVRQNVHTIEGIVQRFARFREDREAPAEDRSSTCLEQPRSRCLEANLNTQSVRGTYLGIDVGSVSVKLTALNADGILFSDYQFSDGKPLDSLRSMLAKMNEQHAGITFAGVGVTGSGRQFIGSLVGADVVKNEISAQVKAASAIMPDVDTIIEIGGQDAKFVRVEDDRAMYFAMNRVCAAGTGAFLHEQAKRLNVDLEVEFSRMAFESSSPVELGSRCTVFMESDLVSHQQQGFAKGDLVAGLAASVVKNYLEKVVMGHPIGNRILFLGGVAKNRAVVAALEAKIEKDIVTSQLGALSGAIGVALATAEECLPAKDRSGLPRQKARRGRSCEASALDFEYFICDDCPNSCRVARTLDAPARYFGGTCGKWDGKKSERNKLAASYIAERTALIDGVDHEVQGSPSSSRPRVGIPRALMAFDQLPAWRTFFTELGCDVVVSPPSDGDLLGEGIKHIVVETCLPVKALSAHARWLDTHADVDYIFIPSLVATGCDRHERITMHCPYIQCGVHFVRTVVKAPLIDPTVNWERHPDDEMRAMVKSVRSLGKSRSEAMRAWQRAREVDAEHRKKLRTMGDTVLAQLSDGTIERAFVLMGKDYNVGDPQLNGDIVSILEGYGEVVITQDMLVDDDGDYPASYESMMWSHGKEILAASKKAAETKGLYPVMVTSFGCGPDSFTIDLVRKIVGTKPMLVIDVDEHSSSVGIETRVEAFIDSLGRVEAPLVIANGWGQISILRPVPAVKQSRSKGAEYRKVFLPYFSDHGFAFASSLRCLGFEPVLTDLPDDKSAALGMEHATSGECHPFVLMLGDYLKLLQSDKNLSGACYFMPRSQACRMAQFADQMRLVSEKFEGDLPIVTRVQDLGPAIAGASFRSIVKSVITYWEMMRGMDFFVQMHLETRAYEVMPGSADRAHAAGRKVLMESVLDDRPLEGLKRAVGLLRAVHVDKSQKRVKIGITGDYYTRICDYSNNDLFREIERLGGVVMIPPTMSEFIKYDTHIKPPAYFHHRQWQELARWVVMRGMVGRRERRVRKIFGDDLMYDVPLDYKRAMKLVEHYMHEKLPPGVVGSLAAVMEQIGAGANGIVSAITFHCNFGLVVNAALAEMDKDYPHIPKLSLIFEGLKPTHNITRLEAFMERVRGHCSGGVLP